MSNNEEYLTAEEVAERLKLDKITIYKMIKHGRIPAVRFGRVWRISSKKLMEVFETKSKE